MVTFMTLNTGASNSSGTIIAVLAAAGAKDPTAIISTTIIATFLRTVAAVTTSRILQRFFPYEEEEAKAE